MIVGEKERIVLTFMCIITIVRYQDLCDYTRDVRISNSYPIVVIGRLRYQSFPWGYQQDDKHWNLSHYYSHFAGTVNMMTGEKRVLCSAVNVLELLVN